MRVRNRKGATELLEANPQYVVLNPLEAKGKWRDLFGNDNPIHVEVGSGKGAFVSGMAKQNPDINYIGIDIQKPWTRFWKSLYPILSCCGLMVLI